MHSSTIHRVGNTPCVTLTGPGLDITLSQGQCAAVVALAEMHNQPAQPSGDDAAVDKLRCWSVGYEYYYDAYFGPDAPFGNQQPTAATLAEVLQDGARMVPQVMRVKDAEIAALRAKLAEAEAHGTSDGHNAVYWHQAVMDAFAELKITKPLVPLYQAVRSLVRMNEDRDRLAARVAGLTRELAEKAEESQRLTQKAREDYRGMLQRKCSDWGTYWRASDSHGVKLNIEQATELLADALGVEVEIADARDEAEAAKAELAAMKARKVKLPLMYGEANKGDPPDIAHGWKMYDDAIEACAKAIRAAGVDCE